MHTPIKLNYNHGLMIIKHEIVNKYDSFRFNIPYSHRDRALVKAGQKINKGDNLLDRKENSKGYTFYVPNHISVPSNEVSKYITCIDGELVNKGDVLIEREASGGLTVKKLISPIDGVVDLTRIESGYIDILGEEDSSIYKSSFSGNVIDVNPVEGIVVDSQAFAMDIKILSKMYQDAEAEQIFGEFITIGDGTDLLLKAQDDDYTNKIVFAGKYLHVSLLQDLFEKGAAFVLTYSMEYPDFRRQSLPLGILGGFGEISCDNKIISLLSKRNGELAIVDLEESQIFFLSNESERKSSKGNFVLNVVGCTVRSLSIPNYSMLGEVKEVQEDQTYITVEWENGSRGIIDIGSVEFISL